MNRALLTGNDGVPLVVEGAREYLVRVALQQLQAVAGVCVPQAGHLVAARRQDASPLGVEARLDVLNGGEGGSRWTGSVGGVKGGQEGWVVGGLETRGGIKKRYRRGHRRARGNFYG